MTKIELVAREYRLSVKEARQVFTRLSCLRQGVLTDEQAEKGLSEAQLNLLEHEIYWGR